MKTLLTLGWILVAINTQAQPMQTREDGFAVAYEDTPVTELSTYNSPRMMATGVEMTAIRIQKNNLDQWYLIESIKKEALGDNRFSLTITTQPIHCIRSNTNTPIFQCSEKSGPKKTFSTWWHGNESVSIRAIQLIDGLHYGDLENLKSKIELPLIWVNPKSRTGQTFEWADGP